MPKLIKFSDMMKKESPEFRRRIKEGAEELQWRIGFARRFRLALHFSTFTQATLARKIGVTWQTVSGYCLGKKVPTVYTLSKIVAALAPSNNTVRLSKFTIDKLLGI